MKKILLSIAFVCYLIVTSGVIVNFHYCMNRLSSTKLFASETKFCDKCGMHNKGAKGCCHDEIKVVKLQLDQQTSQVVYSFQITGAVVSIPSDFLFTSLYNNNESGFQKVHSPPLLTEQDTYLQNRVFRI